MTENRATEIVLRRLVSDRTYTEELRTLLRHCTSLESKAAVIEHYCDQNLKHSLEERLQVQVVPKLLAKTSWTELASRFDEEITRQSEIAYH